ncbi:MAG: hypothetical protein JNL24_11940 [Bacteroidia bacterium]|nr:hypothetical protein [Bacteroidia bacterium]
MELLISDNKTIKNLQDEFNKLFPFLKIEFFSRSHGKGEASPKSMIRNNSKTLGECRKIHSNGSLKISAKQKVSELEQMLQEHFGLSAQVFRKSGKVWLETTSTDDWTLAKQNEQALEFSKPAED